MLRLLAAIIGLGFGSPAVADPPADMPRLSRDVPRADIPREDAADIWLRESAPQARPLR